MDDQILRSWQKNVDPWCTAVREEQIASRREVTNRAIVDAVRALSPATVLDVGCGEGWLLRALAADGIRGFGIDGVPALVERAAALGGGEFSTMTYAEFGAGGWRQPVDLAVFNFSLLGEGECEAALAAVARVLTAQGRCLIQTLHPAFCGYGEDYQSGWREGSWAGFDLAFTDPHPWYYRTLSDWFALFLRVGLRLGGVREPARSAGSRPASIIFELERAWTNG